MPQKETVTIEVVMKASIEKVWEAWTSEALILNWFGSDPNGKGLKARLDVRHGGSFEITFKDSDETEHTCYGVYTDVEELSKLAFTWAWKSEPGFESFVALSLTPDAGYTHMQFEHSNLGHESKHDYLKGWQATFLKLERLLTTHNEM